MTYKSAITPVLALLLACSGKPPGDTASELTADPPGSTSAAEATDSGSTTDEPQTTGSPPGTTTDHGEVIITETTDAPPETGQPCDIWQEDCPEGQKCMPVSLDGDDVWDQTVCAPVVGDPAGLDEPCQQLGDGFDGLDTCDKHLMCWEVDPLTNTSVCLGLCTGTLNDPSCASPEAACQLPAESVLSLCLPTCDPLGEGCPSGQVCIPDRTAEHFICAPDLSGDGGQAFDACAFSNQCGPGHVCVSSDAAPPCDPMEPACCLPFCDLTEPDPCPGLDLECVPWFEPDNSPLPPPHLGVCADKL